MEVAMITDRQVLKLRQLLAVGTRLAFAARKTGMDDKTRQRVALIACNLGLLEALVDGNECRPNMPHCPALEFSQDRGSA
jgi:hypothetical protein